MHRLIIIAFQFMTRLPMPSLENIKDREIGHSQYFYPLVGLFIGLLLIAVAKLSWFDSSFLTATLVLTVWVLITGALHLDGLADCADAWVGGFANKQKTLDIMKDPQSGPVGVTALILSLLIKFAAIESLIISQQLQAFVMATVTARVLIPVLFKYTEYARESGLGNPLKDYPAPNYAILMYLLSGTLIFAIAGLQSIVILGLALLVFLALRQMSIKRIGGFTGDVAGTVIEITEITVLIAFISLN